MKTNGRARHRLTLAAAQHIGNRKRQEDSYAVVETNTGIVVAVADGIGGHPCGDRASAEAVELVRQRAEDILSSSNLFAASDAVQCLIRDADRRITEIGTSEAECARLGCTLVVAAFFRRQRAFVFGAVGDSHVYRIRGEQVDRLNELHGFGHVLTSSVGRIRKVDGEGRAQRFAVGDRYLLCSDGMNTIPWDLLGAVVSSAHDARGAVGALLETVQKIGHPKQDNVTAVVVAVNQAAGH